MPEPTPDLAAIVAEAEDYEYVIRAIDKYEGPTGDDLLPALRAVLEHTAELERALGEWKLACAALARLVWDEYPKDSLAEIVFIWGQADEETVRAVKNIEPALPARSAEVKEGSERG